jgi:hypothetical protein
MKRLLVALLLVPTLAFGAFTEFYCDATNGSNLNSGSDAGTSVYTSTNGNWSTSTHVFTPTDGSNPATASPGVTVGQFASIYVDGASVGVFIGRVTVVANATNGAITIVAASGTGTSGAAPTTSATARTIKVGGCWKGPNAASNFPFQFTSFSSATDAGADRPRVNFKNNASYSVTSNISVGSFGNCTAMGYSSAVGDGGKATFDGGSNAITILTTSSSFADWRDLIFVSSATTSSNDNLSVSGGLGQIFTHCISHGSRGNGFGGSSDSSFIECEAYGNNLSNTSSKAGFATAGGQLIRCYSHDNTGSNTDGFLDNNSSSQSATTFFHSISDTNGRNGFELTGNTALVSFESCDTYNNGTDGIKTSGGQQALVYIENCNFIKNGGWGVNYTATGTNGALAYNNGYGSGTQVNTSGAVTGNVTETGAVTYASGVTPWNSPTTGDFRISLPAANFAGRGVWTQTGNSKTGSVGYPDIGAVQSLTGPNGTFSKETSGGYSH